MCLGAKDWDYFKIQTKMFMNHVFICGFYHSLFCGFFLIISKRAMVQKFDPYKL